MVCACGERWFWRTIVRLSRPQVARLESEVRMVKKDNAKLADETKVGDAL
jgi:hypothetical protein